MEVKVPLCVPDISEKEISVVTETLKSGWLAHGEWNKKFENAFAELIGVPHAISMNSCTSALEIAIKAQDITGEIIVPSFTWCASANSIITSGAKPVFCDVDLETCNVTAKQIEEKITDQTQALMIVHYAGQPCQMDDILSLCKKYNLKLIEDSAETLGATWKGKQAGSFGVGCYSFFPTKNITTAEGGMFTCSNDTVAAKARALIAHGVTSTTFSREQTTKPWLRETVYPGHNYRMPNPLAALGYVQLDRLNELNEKRIYLASRYDEKLSTFDGKLIIPKTAEGSTHVYQMYTIRVDKKVRDNLVLSLRKDGVGASVHFDPPLHTQDLYVNINKSKPNLPNTEKIVSEIITLPIFPSMNIQQQDKVINTLGKYFEKN